MRPPKPPRSAEQRAAIESRDHDILLAAGAGTGKTQVLADRYCGALEDLAAAEVESPAEAILAFTFTERAAAELRERIRATLDGQAADALSRAWISTIHGFCRRVLANHPTRLGLDPRFRVLEAGEADRLAGDAFEAALERFLAGGGPERARLLAVFRLRSLREAILAIHSELRSQGREAALPPAPVPDPRAALERLRAAARGAAEECREGKGTKKADAYRRRIDAAATLADDPLPAAASVSALELDTGAADFSGDCATAYEEAVAGAVKALVEEEAMADYELLRELLAEFAARYADAKAERSGLDFEDLQLQTVRLLDRNDDLRDGYREKFRHLMVDEFQDTNLLQMQLIELLRGPETRLFAVGDELQAIYGFRHADVEVFRALRRALEPAAAERGRVLPLTGNFRSTPGVLAAINLIGEALLGEGFEPLAVGAEPGETAKPGPRAELLLVPAKPSHSLWSERASDLGLAYEGDNAPSAARVAEARMLAARLRDLAADYDQSQMVILLRALTPVAAIEQELRRAGLDPYVVGGRGYWQQQQVDDLRRFLEGLANPLDDLGLLGLLASPAAGISPDALWLIRKAAGRGRLWPALEQLFGGREVDPEDAQELERWRDAVPEADAEALRLFCERFVALRERAALLPLDELIDAATAEFGYDLAVLMRPDGERRTANVRKLMRMARDYEAVEGRDLRGFLDHLDERSGDVSEAEAAVEAEGREVVRIMSVHAAKGLEFPVVAFADCGRGLLEGTWPPAMRVGRRAAAESEERDATSEAAAARVGVRMARFGAPIAPIFDYAELAGEAEAEAVAEGLRLAHVAVTRAAEHLILSGRVAPGNLDREKPANGASVAERLARAWEIPLGGEDADPDADRDAAGSAIEVPTAAAGPITVRIARPTREWADSVRRGGRVADADAQREPTAPLVRAMPAPPTVLPSRLSYTSIAQYEECGFRFYSELVLGLPEDEGRPRAGGSARARALGSAVHVLLEWSARHGWDTPGEERIAAALIGEGVDPGAAEVATAAALVEGWAASGLRAEIERDCEVVRAEVGFALTTSGEAVVGGQIDLLGTRPGRGPLVVDYKTNRLDGSGPRALLEARYSAQRDIYALAAAAGGESVETAFVFLEQPEEPVRDQFGPLELAAARERVEAAVAKIAEGDFSAAQEPSEPLCSGCPAKAGLCPRWRWREGELVLEDAAAA